MSDKKEIKWLCLSHPQVHRRRNLIRLTSEFYRIQEVNLLWIPFEREEEAEAFEEGIKPFLAEKWNVHYLPNGVVESIRSSSGEWLLKERKYDTLCWIWGANLVQRYGEHSVCFKVNWMKAEFREVDVPPIQLANAFCQRRETLWELGFSVREGLVKEIRPARKSSRIQEGVFKLSCIFQRCGSSWKPSVPFLELRFTPKNRKKSPISLHLGGDYSLQAYRNYLENESEFRKKGFLGNSVPKRQKKPYEKSYEDSFFPLRGKTFRIRYVGDLLLSMEEV